MDMKKNYGMELIGLGFKSQYQNQIKPNQTKQTKTKKATTKKPNKQKTKKQAMPALRRLIQADLSSRPI